MSGYVARYPEGHERAGEPIEREQECSRCGRKFSQAQISSAWLNSMSSHSRGALDEFLRTCEVERIDGKRLVFSPARCARCNTRPGTFSQTQLFPEGK